MITHTSDSHQIPSQNKTESKLEIKKKLPKTEILQETLHETHFLKLLGKMYKYEMDPTRTVGATEQTCDAGRTDRRTEWNQYTPPQLCCVRGIISHDIKLFIDQLHTQLQTELVVELILLYVYHSTWDWSRPHCILRAEKTENHSSYDWIRLEDW